ncbi:hypothetical protein CXF72_13365 [Psychromonas sp. MB-3u-54]|uniref:hypothetical protein n=1 Tax=Psychromonas sp. MB-3u-54 TaxID=2058319 RepID=UPI000C34B043|nr:hypothetical protein [Psychromonas sp. MB-3u-54]PKH02100.1 hypothetical protein CXF72_13365 [Psychromonas sp. MB-3u-54]
MNIKKSKIALALGALLFLSVPLSSALADQNHNDVKVAQRGDTMEFIKSELRGYVKGVKSDDAQKMQQHLNKLLTLSTMPANQTADKMNNMPAASMGHEQMGMSEMEHANMGQDDMGMDHSNMTDSDMAMDHSNMADSDMKMDGASHDMSTMEGMSPAQHQHMLYMQGIAGLNDLFKQLEKAQDKTEIKFILGKVKAQLKKNQ